MLVERDFFYIYTSKENSKQKLFRMLDLDERETNFAFLG